MATNSANSGEQINLAAFEQKAREHQKLIDSTNSTLQSLQGDFASNIDSMVTAILGGTDSRGETAASLQAKGIAALQAQQRKSEFLVSLGEDKEAASRLSNQAAEQFAAATREATQLAASVSAKKAVGFFDNPLEFLINQVVLPDEENALAAKTQEMALHRGTIDTINKMESETARNAEEYSSKFTLASVQSQVEGLKNNMLVESLQARQQGILQNVNMLNMVREADSKTLDNYMAVIQARHSAASLALAQQNAVESRARFQQWKKEIADTEAGQAQMLDWINKGATIAGKAPFDSAKMLTLIKTSKGQLPAEIQMFLERGYTAETTGSTAWGQTPTAAFEFSQVTRSETPDWLVNEFASAKKEIDAELMQPNAKPIKDKGEYEARVNQIVQRNLAGKRANVDSRDESNPFLIPATSIIAENAAVKSSALYQRVLATQKLETRDVNVIIARGLEAVKEKTITFAELEAGVKQYIQAGVALNNENSQFSRYAVPPASEYNYTSTVKLPKSFGNSFETTSFLGGIGSEKINLLDSGQLRNYLIKRYAAGTEFNTGYSRVTGER